MPLYPSPVRLVLASRTCLPPDRYRCWVLRRPPSKKIDRVPRVWLVRPSLLRQGPRHPARVWIGTVSERGRGRDWG